MCLFIDLTLLTYMCILYHYINEPFNRHYWDPGTSGILSFQVDHLVGPSLKNCMFAVLLPIIFEVGR